MMSFGRMVGGMMKSSSLRHIENVNGFQSALKTSLVTMPNKNSYSTGFKTFSSAAAPPPPPPSNPAHQVVNKESDSELVSSGPQSTALSVGYADDYYNTPHYVRSRGDPTKRAYTYLILGTSKFIAASLIRVAILKIIFTLSASADVLALGTVEVNLANIPEGQNATIKWRGKPVFIRHRTPAEIETAIKDDNVELRDPQADADRAQRPEWMILLGVCTHLGCVPIANAGDYNGWFCPCHGSHYDISGRIRKGPAPLNLEIPTYSFLEDNKLLLG